MERQEVLETLNRFDAAWPHRKITEHSVEMWVEMLKIVDPGFGESAANALIAESVTYPSIATFVSRSKDFARRSMGSSSPAIEAPRTSKEVARREIANCRNILKNGKQEEAEAF